MNSCQYCFAEANGGRRALGLLSCGLAKNWPLDWTLSSPLWSAFILLTYSFHLAHRAMFQWIPWEPRLWERLPFNMTSLVACCFSPHGWFQELQLNRKNRCNKSDVVKYGRRLNGVVTDGLACVVLNTEKTLCKQGKRRWKSEKEREMVGWLVVLEERESKRARRVWC